MKFFGRCEAEICGWFLAVTGSRSSSEAATPLGRHGTYDEVRDFDLRKKKIYTSIDPK